MYASKIPTTNGNNISEASHKNTKVSNIINKVKLFLSNNKNMLLYKSLSLCQ